MRVLVACEFSGVVRDAFLAVGCDAMSCDLLPTERPGPHYQGDVRDVLGDGWHLMIAHPPCFVLAVSGARYFYRKQREQAEALDFVRLLLAAPVPMIALENPVSVISSTIRPPEQYIQPWQFGDDASKKTGLWLKNLPRLIDTCIVLPRRVGYSKSGRPAFRWGNQTPSGRDKTSGTDPDRWKKRSRTFPGIAAAMASQWGRLCA